MQAAWDIIGIFFLTLAIYLIAIGLIIFIRYKLKHHMDFKDMFKFSISNAIMYSILLLLFAFLFGLVNRLFF